MGLVHWAKKRWGESKRAVCADSQSIGPHFELERLEARLLLSAGVSPISHIQPLDIQPEHVISVDLEPGLALDSIESVNSGHEIQEQSSNREQPDEPAQVQDDLAVAVDDQLQDSVSVVKSGLSISQLGDAATLVQVSGTRLNESGLEDLERDGHPVYDDPIVDEYSSGSAEARGPPEVGEYVSTLSSSLTYNSSDDLSNSSVVESLSFPSKQIVVVDSAISDYETLIDTDSVGLQYFVIDGQQDGIVQISSILDGLENVSELHVISHGAAGQIALGSSVLDSASLALYSETLATWADTFTIDGDILLYGCEIALGNVGIDLVSQISHLTGTDVAASDNLTGTGEWGGDWVLERAVGFIESSFYTPFDGFNDVLNIVSDDFNSLQLDTNVWTFINPLGDATYSMSGSQVMLSVPQGQSHDVWRSGNNAPRIMQSAADTDFEIEVKFDSVVSQRYQMQGIIVEQDSVNFLRVGQYSDGSGTNLFVASFTNGSPTVRYSAVISPGGADFYMRISRQGDRWIESYSSDGLNWLPGADFTFGLSVSSVGAYAGNAGGNPSFTGIVDYFYDRTNTVLGPLVQDITVSDALLSDTDVGVDTFTATVTFDKSMDPIATPALSFSPDHQVTLVNGSGIWSQTILASDTYTMTYDVLDQGVSIADIQIDVSGARDAAGLTQIDYTPEAEFSINTVNPTVTIDQSAGQPDPTSTSPINFTVVFSEIVTDFASADVNLSGTAGATTALVTGSGAVYNVAVSGMTSDGTVIADIAGGAAFSAAGNVSTASTSTDNTVTYGPWPSVQSVTVNLGLLSDADVGIDTFFATVIFDKSMDPTATPILSFSPDHQGTLLNGSGSWSQTTSANDTYTMTYDVSDQAVSIADIQIDVSGAQDTAGRAQVDYTPEAEFSINTVNPTVTIDQSAGQPDPTGTSPINFAVVFSEIVTDFAWDDVTLSGTAGATTAVVTGSGAVYNVAVSGMTSEGTVIADISGGAAFNLAGNVSTASTSTDNTVLYGPWPSVQSVTANLSLLSDSEVGVGTFTATVTFDKSMDPIATPTLSFSPDHQVTLVNGSGIWSQTILASDTYTMKIGRASCRERV